jgi:hypothetical protein
MTATCTSFAMTTAAGIGKLLPTGVPPADRAYASRSRIIGWLGQCADRELLPYAQDRIGHALRLQDSDHARVSLFDYMEVFCNRQRRRLSISYEAPLPFEAMESPDKVSTIRG